MGILLSAATYHNNVMYTGKKKRQWNTNKQIDYFCTVDIHRVIPLEIKRFFFVGLSLPFNYILSETNV